MAFTEEEQRLIDEAVAAGRVSRIEWSDIDPSRVLPSRNYGVGPQFYLMRARFLKSQDIDVMTSPLADIAETLNAGGYRTPKGLPYNYWTAQLLRDYLKKNWIAIDPSS